MLIDCYKIVFKLREKSLVGVINKRNLYNKMYLLILYIDKKKIIDFNCLIFKIKMFFNE